MLYYQNKKNEMTHILLHKPTYSLIVFIYMFLTCTVSAQNINTPDDNLIIPSEEYDFHDCYRSDAPIFNLPVNSVKELKIKTDFEKLFKTEKSEQKRIDGTISYTNEGKNVTVPIRIEAKGKSRFAFCRFKPLDIRFTKSLESTIFEGLEKIFITTHCGETNGDQWIFAGTPLAHRNRVLGEYYMYSILESLETITSSVSLCKVKYVTMEDSVLAEEFAFIVESFEDVAKRCELMKIKMKIHYLDESSLINAKLINHFITNYDWKYEYSDSLGWTGNNVKFLNTFDNIAYVLPYDFDLNAINYPDYWKNESDSFDEHVERFQELLENNFSDQQKLEAPYKIYENIPSFRIMIEDSYMDANYKEKFIYWLDSYESALRDHLSQYRNYRNRL